MGPGARLVQQARARGRGRESGFGKRDARDLRGRRWRPARPIRKSAPTTRRSDRVFLAHQPVSLRHAYCHPRGRDRPDSISPICSNGASATPPSPWSNGIRPTPPSASGWCFRSRARISTRGRCGDLRGDHVPHMKSWNDIAIVHPWRARRHRRRRVRRHRPAQASANCCRRAHVRSVSRRLPPHREKPR